MKAYPFSQAFYPDQAHELLYISNWGLWSAGLVSHWECRLVDLLKYGKELHSLLASFEFDVQTVSHGLRA